MSGGGNKDGQIAPDYTGINLQTSSMSLPVPYAGGLARGTPNLIYYTDFKVTAKSSGKGGGGKGGTTYDYSATILLALCEGPISGIQRAWVNQGSVDFSSLTDFVLFTGSTPQAPWSYLVSNHPTEALGYQGTAYLAAANYDLGTSETIPQHAYEVEAPFYNTGYTGGGDADCALEVNDFLTNEQCGAYFPADRIDYDALYSGPNATTTGDSAYQTYCRAMGWGISPFLESQEQAVAVIARWCQITNTAPVWTGYNLKLVPYGDETITANGVTYIPPTDSVFAFNDGDYVQSGTDDPVTSPRSDWFDAYNAVAIEVCDRSYAYNTVPIDWIDQASNELLGRRQAPVIQGHEICVTAMGFQVVSMIGARMVYIRNLYSFAVDARFSALEPMDCGTITDVKLGLVNEPVRIREIEEQDDGSLKLLVEEFLGALTTGSPSGATAGPPQGGANNSLTVPDPVNPPVIFEPTAAAAAFLNGGNPAPIVVLAVSGGSAGIADPKWGGAIPNISTDGSTYGVLSPNIEQPANMGTLTASLATYGGTNPDNAHTLSVTLLESGGVLQSASSPADAAAGVTLCYVDGELIGFETATLTGPNAYDLTGLYRGLFGSTIGAHSSGTQFARLDNSIEVYPLPTAYIGVPLDFKLQSFNIWGLSVQDLSTCAVYTYTPSGAGSGGGAGGVPTVPTGFTATPSSPEAAALAWNANPTNDQVLNFGVYRAPGLGASFGSAVLVAPVAGQTWTDTGLAAATDYTYFLVANNAVGSSSPTAGENLTTSAVALLGAIYVPSTYLPGTMTADQVLVYHKFGESAVARANLAGFQAGGSANATGSTVILVQRALGASPNSFTTIGTITIGAGTITPTFASVSGLSYAFAIGDVLRIIGPHVPDGTFADAYVTALMDRTS